MSTTRSDFLTALAGGLALPAASGHPLALGHDYLAGPAADPGAEPMWHGYPDECFAFTSFADSLVALAWGYGWYPQPPIVGLRNAIVVDFCSPSEDRAAASIERGWSAAWEFPMGTAATVASEISVNAQNTRLQRQLAFIGTAMRQDEFHAAVVEPLLDSHSCPDCDCAECATRKPRDLADALTILARGTDQGAVQLFSAWHPSDGLRQRVAGRGVELRHHALRSIPADALEANRSYHIWSGTPLQPSSFARRSGRRPGSGGADRWPRLAKGFV
ncbi:MAG TPA: hypothetical protein VJP76_09280 [Candidatus Tumulicola sp.]|nr:hypothetical protein [Candidatus Tumulicola sp.]